MTHYGAARVGPTDLVEASFVEARGSPGEQRGRRRLCLESWDVDGVTVQDRGAVAAGVLDSRSKQNDPDPMAAMLAEHDAARHPPAGLVFRHQPLDRPIALDPGQGLAGHDSAPPGRFPVHVREQAHRDVGCLDLLEQRRPVVPLVVDAEPLAPARRRLRPRSAQDADDVWPVRRSRRRSR